MDADRISASSSAREAAAVMAAMVLATSVAVRASLSPEQLAARRALLAPGA